MTARLIALALLLAAASLTACGGGGTDEDGRPDQTIDPPDCKTHPERCT